YIFFAPRRPTRHKLLHHKENRRQYFCAEIPGYLAGRRPVAIDGYSGALERRVDGSENGGDWNLFRKDGSIMGEVRGRTPRSLAAGRSSDRWRTPAATPGPSSRWARASGGSRSRTATTCASTA